MSERLIASEEYTTDIIQQIAKIKRIMDAALISYTEDDIKVFQHAASIYILANPLLGEEPVFDEFGNFIEVIPLYNITLQFEENWLKVIKGNSDIRFMGKLPKCRVMIPELCARIDYDNS